VQPLDRSPFLARTKDGRLCRKQILGDFRPTDATVDLDEVTLPVDFGTQRASPLQLAVHLPVETLDFDERVRAVPEAFERLQ